MQSSNWKSGECIDFYISESGLKKCFILFDTMT